MRNWFEALAPREKMMIGLAGLLLAVFVFIQFIALPLLRGHAQAASQNEIAARTLAEVSMIGSSTGVQQSQSNEALSSDAFRQVVISTARSRGLAVSRIQSNSSGGVSIVLDEAAPEAIFSWLTELEGAQAIKSDQLVMSGVGDGSGRVRASIDFEGRQ